MAERRMFAKSIVDSDLFLDMPISARLLYYDLGMRADDDGFVNNPKKIIRTIRASDGDMQVLMSRGFIIPFESGIVVIRHWRIHNYIQKDRYRETKYKDEKNSLSIDENHAYNLTECACIQSVSNLDTQVRLGKDSLKEKNKTKKEKADRFFEAVWGRYPNKKGKARISEGQKQKLLDEVGEEQLIRCIDRYIEGLEADQWRKPQNGSTFFNSGYVDYLDENYTADGAPADSLLPAPVRLSPEMDTMKTVFGEGTTIDDLLG